MLSQNYLAIALINAKYDIFNERFITMSELNMFNHFMQKEFNDRELDVVINSDNLSRIDFNISEGVVMQSDRCCYDMDRIHKRILNILTDRNLILKFFIELKSEKLKTLVNLQTEISKSNSNEKIMSFVLTNE